MSKLKVKTLKGSNLTAMIYDLQPEGTKKLQLTDKWQADILLSKLKRANFTLKIIFELESTSKQDPSECQ